jgi:RNA-binding protein
MSTTTHPLSQKHKKHLRGLAHALTPVCWLGSAGVTPAFLTELEATLSHHELIKLMITAPNRTDRDTSIDSITAHTGASLIARIGNVAVLYRPCPTGARLVLPEA